VENISSLVQDTFGISKLSFVQVRNDGTIQPDNVKHIVRYNDGRMKHSQDQAKSPIDSDPVIEVYKKHIDRTLIRENLRLTVDQRFQQLMELQRFAEELQNAGRKARQK
jgi:hypothetical protein